MTEYKIEIKELNTQKQYSFEIIAKNSFEAVVRAYRRFSKLEKLPKEALYYIEEVAKKENRHTVSYKQKRKNFCSQMYDTECTIQEKQLDIKFKKYL